MGKIYIGDKFMKNTFKNINYKSGISLIVLIITIVVALILIATVTISTMRAIDDANVTIFAKDLSEIEAAAEAFYISNNLMPTATGSTIMSKDELVSIARNSDLLVGELTENNDLDSQFYTIDLAKINVTKIAYGTKKIGDNDIFVISLPSMNVYYPYGVTAKGTTYFSITSKISNVKKIAQVAVDTSTSSVISSGGIKLTKSSGWANKMGVNLEVQMAADELLYMSVSGGTNRLIITVTGTNIFGFNLLTSIISNIETIKVPTLTTVEANYIELGTKPLGDRYINILKYKNSEIVGKIKIDLSNFSKVLPTITSATLSSYPAMNTVTLLLSSSESIIKEVRYEYLTKYTDSGTIDNYYSNVTSFDSVYMQSKAKKAVLSANSTTINAPKNVQSIKVAIIDNAGNINLYNQEIAPRLYIGYSLDSSTTDSLQLTAKMFSVNGIKSINFSKSLDGITFTDEQVYTLNTTANGVTNKQAVPYTNISQNVVYIKMIAVNYDNTITETRTITINLTTPAIPVIAEPIILPAVNLGKASTFAILAGTTITNTGPTIISGDIGLFPGTTFTGSTSVTLSGTSHLNDALASEAKNDLFTAYNEISETNPETLIPTELGGTTLLPGTYYSESGTFQITGTLTLDANNDPNAIFIFKTETTLITAAASNVNLINGAKNYRIFWNVGSSVTLGASSRISGHILAFTSISVGNAATIKGQLLAKNGAVTLDTNTITNYISE